MRHHHPQHGPNAPVRAGFPPAEIFCAAPDWLPVPAKNRPEYTHNGWLRGLEFCQHSPTVDEKPSIQALERAQGYLRLPDGKAVNGFSHCYTRHGTTTLFAVLEVTTGPVKTAHYQRRRRREFLDFMNEIVSANPGCEIHVVLDNLNTHKPKENRWPKHDSQVHFHFIPAYSSWLNQVECWFRILSRQALRGASFASPRQPRQPIPRLRCRL
jgi:transposase